LTVDDAGAPAGNAAGSEIAEAAADTIGPVTLAVGIDRNVFGVAIAARDGGHLGDGLGLLLGVILGAPCQQVWWVGKERKGEEDGPEP
jgi:hypothetical protein